MTVSCGTRNTVLLSLSLLLLSLSPLSSSLSPSQKVTEALLDKICSDPSIQRHFCINRLRSMPRAFTVDLHGLLGLTLETADSICHSNQALMNSLAKTSSDNPRLKAQYRSCSSIYAYAIGNLKRAKVSFRARRYPQVSRNMYDAFSHAGSCEDEFDGPSSEPPLVLHRNKVFERFCNIARVISDLLTST